MNFTAAEIRDAAGLLVEHYGEAVKKGRLDFYNRSHERVMDEVAANLVRQSRVTHELAALATPDALYFVRNKGRWPERQTQDGPEDADPRGRLW